MQCSVPLIETLKVKSGGKLEVREINSVNEGWHRVTNLSQLAWNSPGSSTEILSPTNHLVPGKLGWFVTLRGSRSCR